MHIVLIVGSYYPYYSAVGRCAGNIAQELEKNNKVTVICLKNNELQLSYEKLSKHDIIRVDTKDISMRNRLKMNIKARKGIIKKFYRAADNLYKIRSALKTILSYTSVNNQLRDAYIHAIEKISSPIDVIVPFSLPFESVLAASKYIENIDREVKLIPFLFDQFVNSQTLHRSEINKKFKKSRHLKLEKEMLNLSFNVLAMHSLKKHFELHFPGNLGKIKFVEHPLILDKNKKSEGEKYPNKPLIISYVGGLYKRYVTPEYLFKIFKSANNVNSILNFYIIGNCNEMVNKYSGYFPGKIVNHGSVDKETADQAISESDILVSIAEKEGIQMSSKIFDYISNKKPIIHLYTVQNDVNLKILNKYPLSLCLQQDNSKIKENSIKYEEFCEKIFDLSISFEEIKELFTDALPSYSAELILSLATTIHPSKRVN
ncbi:hypothetical protein [Paenibacillus piscarius]|uniref:hypothetical protein n=1 Tax=Paenibacillus piscarius TaxID=1089681 RepID=UPI001EE997DA|nr:hypothetical protein [Paenibacillus piscarius]